METTSLAAALATALAPFLPYLLQVGGLAAEGAITKFGSDAWDEARGLWGKLRVAGEIKPAVLDAALDVAQESNDEDARAALRLQLRKFLQEQPHLVAELEAGTKHLGDRVQMIVSGTRAVGLAGGMHGGTIHTGDVVLAPPARED
jgi:hypothetical protein